MKEKWEDNFQKVFSDYERKVPDGLLDDIKREIEKRKLVPNAKKSSATLIPLWARQAHSSCPCCCYIYLHVSCTIP